MAGLLRASPPAHPGGGPYRGVAGVGSMGGLTEHPQLANPARGRMGRQGTALTIRVSAGSASGRTPLSAFDAALREAGVADFNLVRLSSVIPPGSTVVDVHGRHQLTGGHGDLLYCVYAAAYAYAPGQTAWAGVGWALDRGGSGGGLFVEHDAPTRADLEWALASSLDDLSARRGGGYAPAGSVLAAATCTSTPACAVVIASYRREGWGY